jgi:glycosyltransferase involved in cell wall biosynthesis
MTRTTKNNSEGRPIRSIILISPGITPNDPAKEEADERSRGSLFEKVLNTVMVDEQYLSKTSRWRKWIYRILPVSFSQVMETFIIKKRYDVVISWSDMNGLLFALVLKLTRSKFPHVSMMYWPSKPKKAFLLKHVHPYITTLCLWTTTHRKTVVERLGVPPEKIVMVPHLVDQKFFRPMPRETDTICAVGQEMRDYLTLIEAMRGLDINCHIAAGLSPGSKMHETVKVVYSKGLSMPPNVTAAPLSQVQLRDLYARSRFVVVPLLPTDSDNGSLVITEAMAMGKAVICSLTEGQRDVIVEGKTGIYVPQGDPKALREAIVHLWTHPEIAEQMGREGRKRIEEKFTLDNFAETIKRIAEDTVARVRSSGD